jgi:3-oxoacyl-[acyl-carrier-protein] synthase-1
LKPIFIDSYTATTCVGPGNNALESALQSGTAGLLQCDFDTVSLDTWIGKVANVDCNNASLPTDLKSFDCRNNRLAFLGLQQDGFDARIRETVRTSGHQRVGIFLGTSTSAIYDTELAYRNVDSTTGKFSEPINYSGSHSISSLCNFVRAVYGIQGPGFVISTACSSSAKVFAAAQRFMALGLIDAALVGGVDSLCLTTLYGFNSLQLTSEMPCRPYDQRRNGISIGEAAAFALLTKHQSSDLALLGYGESSDAYHMSSPHPDGLGAKYAMELALKSAGLVRGDIDYINLHGTSTPSNDRAEGIAVNNVFGERVACSSTKGVTGHTLGAAGAVEAVACFEALRQGFIPGSVGTETLDPAIHLNYQLKSSRAPVTKVLSNSFGFGGSNCSLIFGKQP